MEISVVSWSLRSGLEFQKGWMQTGFISSLTENENKIKTQFYDWYAHMDEE